VSWTNYAPLGIGGVGRRSALAQGYQPGPGEDLEFAFGVVGPHYFETMEIGLVSGRGIGDTDRAGAPRVAVVNESMARYFWPGGDALGKRLSRGGNEGPWLEVVGVARDSRYNSLGEAPKPVLYTAGLQEEGSATLLVATEGDPASLVAAVRERISSEAPGWAMGSVRTMEEQLGTSLLPQRVASWIFGAFGVLAVLLAAIGLYGVIAYAAAQRTREIGIRMALGATRADVMRLVGRQGFRLVLSGIIIGMLGAFAVARMLGALLLGTSTGDPITFIGAPVILAAVALFATYLPARRATRVDPMVALRGE
jgi:putative ABC transport system permease protein